jgi:PAS domain S-box-containing protein
MLGSFQASGRGEAVTSLEGVLPLHAGPDFRALFELTPGMRVALEPDAPRYSIAAVSQGFAHALHAEPEALIGRALLELLPENVVPQPSRPRNLAASLERTLHTQAPDTMAMQRFEIRKSPAEGGGVEERWWSAVNYPVFSSGGKLLYIVCRAEDVTDLLSLKQAGREPPLMGNAGHVSEAQSKELLELASDGILIADLSGRCLDVNRAGCAMLGYAREALLGRSVVDLIPVEDGPRLLAVKQALLRGDADVGEWILRKGDGTWLPAEVSMKILPDGRWQSFFRDTSKRKEMEKALRLSEAKFSGIVSISADAIISVDEQQRIIIFNEGAERIFGYTRAEAIGAPLDILIPEALRSGHRAEVERFATGEHVSLRMGERGTFLRGLRKNGDEFQADAAISKLEVSGRRILTVTVRDMTLQKRAENEQRFLSEVGTRLASSLDYDETLTHIAELAVGELADVCIVDVLADNADSRRVRTVSRDPSLKWACDVLTRMPFDRNRPNPTWAAVEEKRPVLVEALSPQMVAVLAQTDERLEALNAISPKSLMAVPLLVRSQAIGVLIFLSSAPERRYGPEQLGLAEALALRGALFIENARLYRAAHHAVQVRDEVLGIVAHDLRSPLNSILMTLEVLKRHGEPERRATHSIEAIRRSARRMNRLIEDLLDLTRMEAGHLRVGRENINVGHTLTDFVEAQEPLLSRASIELRVELTGSEPDISADRDRFLQILENLVGNAIKFTQPGGLITIGATPREDMVLFRVSDTGSGIAEEDLPHVFDRFWQGQGGKRRGAGLGLQIIKGLVQAYGGRIWVESTPGAGSTFYFTLPRAEECRAGEASRN